MTDASGDTRARILRTAQELFALRGYQRTSLREIAARLRLTKAAILYHYPSKEHLMAALVEPLIADLEAMLESGGQLPPERARWAVVTGWVDTMLAHRRPLGMLVNDLSLVSHGPTYQRLWRIALRANELVAGPDAGRRERVWASQAIAMASDPVVFFGDAPVEEIRADMLAGIRRLLGGPVDGTDGGGAVGPAGEAGESGRGRAGRRTGRPRALTPEQIATARRWHASGTTSADEIAAALGVSRATVYRHLADGERAPSTG